MILLLKVLQVMSNLVRRAVKVVCIQIALKLCLEVGLRRSFVNVLTIAISRGQSVLVNIFFTRAEVVWNQSNIMHSCCGSELTILPHFTPSHNNALLRLIARPFVVLLGAS